MAQEVPPNGPWLSRGSTRWAVYVAHFLSEPRVRSALLRQLLTSHARATPLADPAELPWPELPPGYNGAEHRGSPHKSSKMAHFYGQPL